MPMKIGIDAKWYFEGNPSGKRVVKNLVDYILKIDDKNEYVIFLDRKYKKDAFPVKEGRNLKLCYVWAGINALSNIFVLPFYTNRFKLDATLYQTYISPFDRGRKIAYIHDILYLSNPEYYTFIERVYFSPVKFLIKLASAIITVSNEEKKRLLHYKHSRDPEKIIVAYHGVDASFAPRANQSASAIEEIKRRFSLPDQFLLYVGRLNLRKNLDNLVRAIALLKNTKIPLVIVGGEDLKKTHHIEIIKQLGIENRIHSTGAVYKDLNLIYSLATIFCFPSHAESFGLPPLEAMASGVPVVVSNTTSLPEICGDAGNYVDPESPQDIASAIDSLLINDQLYEQKKKLGLIQAKKFRWEQSAQITIDCIESCIGKNA
jgi:glycosyltransferase involved in cell wall biosynthesis